MIIKIPVSDDFSLTKIVKFRPFFFFFYDAPVRSFMYGGKRIDVEFFQDGGFLALNAEGDLEDKGIEFLRDKVRYCFGTGENLSDFYSMASDDTVLSKYIDAIHGNRLLSAFSDFEAAVSIICSQNVSFRQYKAIVKKIVDAYGEGKCFPRPDDVLAAPELLSSCGTGYRERYILDACRYFRLREKAEPLRLTELVGFGQYSLDIFRLFQLREYSYFYVDRLIKRIFREEYGAELMNDFEVRSFAKSRFGKYAGLCEVYLQKFLVDNK